MDPNEPIIPDDPNAQPAPEPAADPPAAEPTEVELVDQALADAGEAEPESAEPAADSSAGDDEPAAPADKDKPADAPKDDKDKPAPPETDAEIAAEATALGLKGKSNERFVAMATEIKALAPVKAELEKAGIKDVAEIPAMVERAKAADDMIAMVMETGASAEQYGSLLDYAGMVNKAQAGDAKAAEAAFSMIQREYIELAKALGKDVPGVFDPLAAHPDLEAEIDGGMARERALEIAEARRQSGLREQVQQQAVQRDQQTRAEQSAVDRGAESLRAWEADKLADPKYLAVRDQLSAEVVKIRQQFQPAQWAAATELAYRAIAAQASSAAPPPPPAKPAPGPMRPGGVGRTYQQAEFATAEDAVEAALASL